MEQNQITIKIIYMVDGEQVEKTETLEYDPEKSGIVAEIEYTSPSDGGPVMRPRKPRIWNVHV